MTFQQLPLFLAVYRVYHSVEKPGSEDWISNNAKAAYKLVMNQLIESEAWTDNGIPYGLNDVVSAWRCLRKVKKARQTCRVAMIHGSRCFYADRGRGSCCDKVELDRIVPGSRGGLYTIHNCIISCRKHNGMRSDMSIEQFLARQHENGLLCP